MLFALLRPVAAIALRLFYRQIESAGVERIPTVGPVLVVANHPNALVDALVVGTTVPRRVYMTAKATLFANPVANLFLRSAGVIPLRRAKDERTGALDPNRNVDSFRAVHETLAEGRALMIFPEGITHDEPAMAPLRTGAARMALQARDDRGVRGLVVVPIGLVFSRKDAPRSRVLVEVGDPIAMDGWIASRPETAVDELTAEIAARLRAVTLNFASLDDAAQATALAGMLARLLSPIVPSLETSGPPQANAAAIARRLEELRVFLPGVDGQARDRVTRFVGDLEQFRSTLRDNGLRADDLAIAHDVSAGARFVVRELWIVAVGGPIALWGWVNHWIPFRAARALATRSADSATDPAMRTIVGGALLLLITYALQGALMARLLGTYVAVVYLISLPIAAEINFLLSERLRRAVRRSRAFLRFRRDPSFHSALVAQAAHLRGEALALDRKLSSSPPATS